MALSEECETFESSTVFDSDTTPQEEVTLRISDC